MQLSADLTLENVKKVAKQKSNVMLPRGYGSLSPQLLAHFLKQWGAFDYLFTQNKPDANRFFVSYFDYERVPKGKNKWVLGTCVYEEGVYTLKKLNVNDGSDMMQVWPGKPGYLLVSSYFRKERKMTLVLKKIEY